MRDLPPDSVRGRIRAFLERHAGELGDDVLEIGARMHDARAWWCTCRDLAMGQWLSTDMQPGPNVDEVFDMHSLPAAWRERFTGAVCSEVLEHVARPWIALPKLRGALRPGGTLLLTTLVAFPLHGYPDDFWRFTPSGLELLLHDAGFDEVTVETAGTVRFELNDHGERGLTRLTSPMHVFAVARC